MTDEQPIVMPEPVSKTAMLNKILTETKTTDTPADLPLGFDGDDEGALPTSPITEADVKGKTPDAEVKIETKSAKAARESRELRAAKTKEAELESKLSQALTKAQAADDFAKVKELISSNPKEALKLLGVESFNLYQTLTDQYLNGDKDMKPKDPMEERLKKAEDYATALKKRDDDARTKEEEKTTQENIKTMLARDIYPIIDKAEEYECLYDYFSSQDDKLTPEQVKNAVAKSIYDNANDHFNKNYSGNHQKLLKEFGNYQTYLSKVASHLETQLEQQIEKAAQKVAKLNKFKKSPKQSAAETTVSEETHSTEIPTLDEVVSNSSQTPASAWQPKDHNKAAAIQALLKKNGL